MELICPSCEARYGIPDGSIGEKGRQVSCMNCGHSWHAFPPLVLGAAQAAGSPSAGMQWRDPDTRTRPPQAAATQPGVVQGGAPAWTRPPETPAPVAASSGFAAAQTEAGSTASDRSAASRSEQLAEIREMLAEVQSEDRAAATRSGSDADLGIAGDPRTPRPDPDEALARRPASDTTQVYPETAVKDEIDRLDDELDDSVDPLRRRMEMFDNAGNSKPEKTKPTNVKKLRKNHDRKAKRKRADSAGSGAFLTGFLLIAIISSVMISLYLLHPQIIERLPATEKPLVEYVAFKRLLHPAR
ncbi:MAG: zinc-ribbon domain-containing protein, partial [Pseudomonadota bacterium]